MVNPRTVNAGIIIPNTGADVGTWGSADVNPNMVSLDGWLCGVQTVGLTNVPVTLTSPAGFTATPGGGPTQAENRMLRLTGTLTADVTITLPLPGSYLIDNQTVSGSHVIVLRGAVATTEVIALPPSEICEVFNDGSRVKFCGLARMAALEFWAGVTVPPSWLGSCTVFPYLICDGTVRNISSFPALGARLGSAFGGDGISTFGVPDLRGRYPLAYDATGTRVTVAGSGLNGQTMGAALDAQTVTLTTAQMPSHSHANTLNDPQHHHNYTDSSGGTKQSGSNSNGGNSTGANAAATTNASTGITINNAAAGNDQPHNNMPNTQVAGIWVIKT